MSWGKCLFIGYLNECPLWAMELTNYMNSLSIYFSQTLLNLRGFIEITIRKKMSQWQRSFMNEPESHVKRCTCSDKLWVKFSSTALTNNLNLCNLYASIDREPWNAFGTSTITILICTSFLLSTSEKFISAFFTLYIFGVIH